MTPHPDKLEVRVTEVLHDGARGRVCRGVRVADDRPVVVKTVAAETASSAQWERVHHEFEMSSRLGPSVVPRALQVGLLDGRHW